MPFEYTALSVDIDEDLLPLSALLHQRGLAHRIYEEGGRQVLKVTRAAQVAQVETLYRAWRAGELNIELRRRPREPRAGGMASAATPVTLALILLSIAGFLLVYLGAPMNWISLLAFTPFEISGDSIRFGVVHGQYWRLITPAFLHFGWLHIVFNSLWLWELGRKVEGVMGHWNMLVLFLVIAAVSNVSQFLASGPGLFGGMSGVVYGMLGFSWLGATLQPRWPILPSRGIMLFMTGWLVICAAGFTESLGLGRVANAAHVGGLVAGAALGGAFGLLSRYNPPSP